MFSFLEGKEVYKGEKMLCIDIVSLMINYIYLLTLVEKENLKKCNRGIGCI